MEKKYLVIGCARSGVAAVEFLLGKGEKVVLTDNKDEKIILEKFPQVKSLVRGDNIECFFGQQPPIQILEEIEEIIMSPGVPLDIDILEKARELNISIISEVELAYRYSRAQIIAITGTNGKTTTTTLTGEIFKNSGRKTYIVGNIGDPIIKYVDIAESNDIFIAEISSFQLETINRFKANLSVILNISPDHLDRHKTMENYIKTKCRIFENSESMDYCLINADDEGLRNISINSKCNNIFFSVYKKVSHGAYIENETITIAEGDNLYPICHVKSLKIPGIHNVKNALAASALAYFGGVSIKVIKETLESFSGVEHRLELVRVLDGVTYINDSKGTNTDASTIAIQAINEPIILIAGGYDKHSTYDEWIKAFDNKVKHLIVLGETADKIIKSATENNFYNYTKVSTLADAIKTAYKLSDDGDSVLLSPACASWDMFDDFEQRGRVFKEIVYKLGG